MLCQCGCGQKIDRCDNRGRKRFYFGSHGGKKTRFTVGHKRTILENNARWMGGITHNTKGYILIKSLNHPYCNNHGYVMEHRLVMEEYLGRYLIPNVDDVHHINGNRQDNRIENLQLLEHGKHTKLHSDGNAYNTGKHWKWKKRNR